MNDDIISLPNGDFYVKPKEEKPNRIEYFSNANWLELTGHKEGWYFWDERWINCYGPYETEDEAKRQLKRYTEIVG